MFDPGVFSAETHSVGSDKNGPQRAQRWVRLIWIVGWVLFWLAVLG